MNNKSASTKKLTYCALFTAIATVLMYFETPIPLMPPFLKLDISGSVSLLASFMFGWPAAVAITFVKNLIHLPTSSSGGVGQIADFFMISAFCITSSIIYRKMHTKAGAVIGMTVGTIIMALIGVVTNKYMLIPFYENIMPVDAIISACSAVNPAIDSISAYLWFGALPFNLFKGGTLTLITGLLYKRLSIFIKTNTIKEIANTKFSVDNS